MLPDAILQHSNVRVWWFLCTVVQRCRWLHFVFILTLWSIIPLRERKEEKKEMCAPKCHRHLALISCSDNNLSCYLISWPELHAHGIHTPPLPSSPSAECTNGETAFGFSQKQPSLLSAAAAIISGCHSCVWRNGGGACRQSILIIKKSKYEHVGSLAPIQIFDLVAFFFFLQAASDRYDM